MTEVKTYKLLEVCDLIQGKRTNKVKDGEYPIYGAGSVIGYTDDFNCSANTIRLTGKGTVGRVYFHDTPFWLESGNFSVEPKEMIDKMYLYHWLCENENNISSCKKGNTLPGLDLNMLSKIEIQVPDMEYQINAVKLLQRLKDDNDWFIEKVNKQITALQELKSAYENNIFESMRQNANECE